MNTAITQDIQDSIKKNLPAAVGSVLQERLALIDKLERQVTQLQEQNDMLRKKDSDQLKQLLTQEQLTARETLVTKREADVAKREAQIELNEFKVKAADDKAAAVVGVVYAVFANSRLKYQESSSVPVAVPGSPGCAGYVTNHNLSKAGEIEQ